MVALLIGVCFLLVLGLPVAQSAWCPLAVDGVRAHNWSEVDRINKASEKYRLVEVTVQAELPCRGFLNSKLSKIYARPHTSDLPIAWDILQNHEFQKVALVWQAKPPKRIMDLGANIGLASAYMATACPDASIVSLEPSLGNFAVANLNTRRFPNVRIVWGGIWEQETVISIRTDLPWRTDSGHVVAAVDSPAGLMPPQAIPGYTVESLMRRFQWDNIDFLKVDVETAEKYVFGPTSLASGWLNKVSCVSIELHERHEPGCCDKPFFDAMNAFNFRFIMKTRELHVYCQQDYPTIEGV